MSEGRRGSGVGQVVRGDVDRLDRGDRTLVGGGDAFLHRTHLRREVGLVAHRTRHSAEKRGHFRTGLGESEDVVHEDQGFLARSITEFLRHGEARKTHSETCARRFVHLTEDHGHLVEDVALVAFLVGVLRFRHLTPEVVAFTGSFTDAAEDRVTTEVSSDSCDHLLDDDGLAHARTAEEADLATTHEGAHQVDDLDAGFEDLGLGVEVDVRGRITVDRVSLVGVHRTFLVDWLAEEVEHASEDFLADGHGHTVTGVDAVISTSHAVGGRERHATDESAAEVLGDFSDENAFLFFAAEGHFDRVVDLWEIRLGELDIEG